MRTLAQIVEDIHDLDFDASETTATTRAVKFLHELSAMFSDGRVPAANERSALAGCLASLDSLIPLRTSEVERAIGRFLDDWYRTPVPWRSEDEPAHAWLTEALAMRVLGQIKALLPPAA